MMSELFQSRQKAGCPISDYWVGSGFKLLLFTHLHEPLFGEIEHLLRTVGGDVGRKLH
jgi:ABC-type cobalt transport system substrate-binding protein